MRGVMRRPLRGVIPIAPTPFLDSGALDLDGQRRALDFLIDAGVDGICLLANYSEQFALTDDERTRLMDLALDHLAGRVPVVVTTSHFSTRIAAERSRQAQAAGADMVMLMPPYHGATLRASETDIRDFFARVADACSLPIMVQDAPVSGTTLSARLLAEIARSVPSVRYFKIEMPGAASKLRELLELGRNTIEGPFDGEESITLLPDLDAGATGTMPSAVQPELLSAIVRAYSGGQREEAIAGYERSLPLINFENRQCGLRATKVLMHEGGIIASEQARHPTPSLPDPLRAGLLELARRLDPLILRWARD
ncbi:MAG: dihydrodipicolinate synthase family protein [Chloroflexi bacterium]|nr:dihydrodipicolinate synthase family protein [Chloroflexota bacterium]